MKQPPLVARISGTFVCAVRVCVRCWEFKPFTCHRPRIPDAASAATPAALPVDYSINLIMRCQSFRCPCAASMLSCACPRPLTPYTPASRSTPLSRRPCISLLLPLNFCRSFLEPGQTARRQRLRANPLRTPQQDRQPTPNPNPPHSALHPCWLRHCPWLIHHRAKRNRASK